MDQPGVDRRLAAIFAADVIGYSRLMEVDKRRTRPEGSGKKIKGGRKMNRTLRFTLQSALGAAVFAGAILATVAESRAQLGKDWCKGVTIRFFTGGAAGDAFGSIVQAGAVQAGIDTGAKVELLFSGWDPEVMIQQLREAVAVKPDGIAMMGHPGPAAIAPLADGRIPQKGPLFRAPVRTPREDS